MIKKFLVVVVLILLHTIGEGYAQGKFRMGFKGGVNLSTLSMGNFLTTRYDDSGSPQLNYNGQTVKDNLKESLDSKTGFTGGIYMRFGSGIYIQPEVLVSTKGGYFDIDKVENNQPTSTRISYKYSSIDVPILFGLKGGPIRLNAGPVISYRIGDNQGVFDAIKQYTQGKNSLNEGFYGYQFGGGIDLGGISIDIRREGTFSNLSSFQVSTGDGGNTLVEQKLKSWQVTIGFRIL